jgi:hypothetical protein
VLIEGVKLEPPATDVAALVPESRMESVLLDAGLTSQEIDDVRAAGIPLTDFAAIEARTDIDLQPFIDDIRTELIAALQADVESALETELQGNASLTAIETDWSAWDGWAFDLSQPSRSIEVALDDLPVRYRLVIASDSLGELLQVDDEPTLRDVIESEALMSVGFREIALRSLLPDEIEPETGWPSDAERDRVAEQLRDPDPVFRCTPSQRIFGEDIEVEMVLRPAHAPEAAPLLRAVGSTVGETCGFRLDVDEGASLRSLVDRPFETTISLAVTPGSQAFHLGGYLIAVVEVRLAIPGSLSEL